MPPKSKAEKNKRTVRRLTEEVTEGNLDAIDDIFTEDVIDHTPIGDVNGRTATKEMFGQLVSAFSDRTITLEDILAEGDRVSSRVTWNATHEGKYQGIEPTGKTVEFSVIEIHRFEDGKIAERWIQPDQLGLLQQLGVVEQSRA